MDGENISHVELPDEWSSISSLHLLKILVDALPGSIYIKDRQSRFVLGNAEVARFMGARCPEDLVGKTDRDFYPEDEARGYFKREQEMMKKGGSIIEHEEYRLDSLKRARWLSTTKMCLRNREGAVIGLVGCGKDITQRKEAEDALAHERYLTNALMDTIPDFIYFKDRKSRYIRVNKAASKRFGAINPSIVVGKTADDFYSKEYAQSALADEQAIMEGDKPVIGRVEKEVFADGRERWVSTTKMPLKNKQGAVIGTYRVSRDITEYIEAEEALKSSEEQLLQAQKIEAVGRLAGGVAHDFNNILTAIIGYSDYLLMKPSLDNSHMSYIEQIKIAAERAASLTDQLLSFSRKQILRPEVINPNTLIADLEKMLSRLIGEDIRVRLVLSGDTGFIRADPGQIEQVIVNLAVNSRDAMPVGGTLTIKTATADFDEDDEEKNPEMGAGSYVMIRMEDTGCGMDGETMEHIFEPFFTTKDVGKGTGLGLSTVYGIIKQSGGYIYAESTIGRGTSFTIYLPRVEPEEKGSVLSTAEDSSVFGSETVLLVEDEAAVRNMIGTVLREYGYRVFEAENGNEALRIYDKEKKTIDLIITDVVMPGMSGREVIQKIERGRSGVRVLYISGYSDDSVVRHGIQEDGVHFLQKPFTPSELSSKVRQILDRGN